MINWEAAISAPAKKNKRKAPAIVNKTPEKKYRLNLKVPQVCSRVVPILKYKRHNITANNTLVVGGTITQVTNRHTCPPRISPGDNLNIANTSGLIKNIANPII
jgi:hypothetical protein